MNKRQYRGFSYFQFIWTLAIRFVLVVSLIYTLLHFDENPVVISIVSAICIIFIFIIGDEQIVVSDDKIIQTKNSLASFIFKVKGKTYEINNIKSAYLQPKQPVKAIDILIILAVLLVARRNASNKTHPIFFELNDGVTVKFDTTLENREIQKIVDTVNLLTTKNSH